ncbi:MAG: hypothetical protein VX000_03115, partial [Myxococcota bacterium]|nr:hypothetical protein [Myxococcota bacterium]
MGRILVVEPDPRIAQALARLLHGSGHAAEMVVDEMAALACLIERPADLVLAAAGPGGALARRTWSALESLEPAPDIVWTGSVRAMVLPMLEAQRGRNFLETPPAAPALQGLLARLVGTPASADSWSGLDFLQCVDGTAERYPPARVLFLAHRVNASGVLSVESEDGDWTVSLKKGRITDASGIANLESDDGPVVSKDAQGLMAALGAAIGAGTDPETAMTAAGVGIARAAIRATGTEGAMVRFVPDEPQGSVMTLPGRLPRLLAAAARKERPAPAIRSMLGGRRKSSIQARFPDDAPESQWGLPPTALRLLRDGARVDTLGELLGAARGGETDEVWAAVDLLLCLGLLELGESIGGTGRIVEPERDDIEIETIDAAAEESDGGAEQGDEEANSLRAWFEEHRTSDPWVVLGIDDSEQMTSEGVEAAFRAQSANFHPDIYLTASKP